MDFAAAIGVVAAVVAITGGVAAAVLYFLRNDRATGYRVLMISTPIVAGIVLVTVIVANLRPGGAVTGHSHSSADATNTVSFTSAPTPTPTDALSTATPSPTVPPATATTSPAVSLAEMTPIDGSDYVETQPASLGGVQYLDLVRQDEFVCGSHQTDYDLGMKYSRFTAKAGLSDTYSTPAVPWIFAVYSVGANGQTTLFKQEMKFGQIADINLSVQGVLRLRLSIEWIDPGHLVTCSPYNEYSAVWAKPTLTP